MRKFSELGPKSGRFYLFAFGLVMLFITIFLIVRKVLAYTQGVFMYPFDDTFIHLTIAENLHKGNWGINENEFASGSSSILYTLILFLFGLLSKSVLLPFVVNCIAGVAALISLHLWLRKHLISYVGQGCVFLLVIFFTPLPLMIVSGMEHTLQCLFSFLFIFYFSDWLEEMQTHGKQTLGIKILIFAVLVSSIRYEGLFLVGIACLFLLVRGKFFQAVFLASVSLLPVLIFGFVALKKGSYFLPNSVLVKSGSFDYSNPFQLFYNIIFERLVYARNGLAALSTQRLIIILPLLYLVSKKFLRPSYFFILVFLFGVTILQLSFASTGYLYRYEAYLFFCFMIILPVIFYKYGKQIFLFVESNVSRFFLSVLLLFLFFPLILRSLTALSKASQACINIYDQQYQMALFTRKYFSQGTIALNDIGAVGYFTDAKILDLWGLANIEVTRSKKNHYWTPNFIDSMCRSNKVQIAMIYDSWFPETLTKSWNKAATWQIKNNVICGDSVVSFYCIEPSLKALLQQRLKSVASQLPQSIVVKYY